MIVEKHPKPKRRPTANDGPGTRKQAIATGRMSAAKRGVKVSLAPVNLPKERDDKP